MRVELEVGRDRLDLDVAENKLIASRRGPEPPADPAAAVRAALEAPFHFPPLRRALTPDDRLAIVVDEQLPNLAGLLTPVLEHVVGAGVAPEAITLVSAPSPTPSPWVDDLPDEFEEARV